MRQLNNMDDQQADEYKADHLLYHVHMGRECTRVPNEELTSLFKAFVMLAFKSLYQMIFHNYLIMLFYTYIKIIKKTNYMYCSTYLTDTESGLS